MASYKTFFCEFLMYLSIIHAKLCTRSISLISCTKTRPVSSFPPETLSLSLSLLPCLNLGCYIVSSWDCFLLSSLLAWELCPLLCSTEWLSSGSSVSIYPSWILSSFGCHTSRINFLRKSSWEAEYLRPTFLFLPSSSINSLAAHRNLVCISLQKTLKALLHCLLCCQPTCSSLFHGDWEIGWNSDYWSFRVTIFPSLKDFRICSLPQNY